MRRREFLSSAAGIAAWATGAAGSPSKKRIAFVAGRKTHGFGEHAHNAGCLFLAKCLNDNVPGIEAAVHQDGWPDDPSFFDGAAALVVFADGGDRHPILPHLGAVDRLMRQGAGLAMLHYALCVPKGESGDKFLEWIGGFYETYWSVNPSWTARFNKLPEHPITRGVRPFAIYDEWYYHMRFRKNMEGITPILTAVPPDSTREGPFGPHSGNAVVRSRKGMPEHVAWAYQRPDGGRGFGFTGGHFHWAWGHDEFRRIVLNGIVWIAGLEPPVGGVRSSTPAWEELLANQEGQMPEGFSREQAEQAIRPRK
jgi:type 1 glutamine amidotransferase